MVATLSCDPPLRAATVPKPDQFVLATPVVLGRAGPSCAGLAIACYPQLNMFTLIAMGMGAPGLQRCGDTHSRQLPAAFRGMDGTVMIYFEAAAVITVLVLLGQVLELRARAQTSHPCVARHRAEDGAAAECRRLGGGGDD